MNKLILLSPIILAFPSSCIQNKNTDKNTKPNIIFFIADDMRPEHFNCLSESEAKYLSPNIDRLASEGVIMTNQHVVSPVCSPSRYNVLTGNYSSRATNREFINFTEKQGGQTCIQWNTFITPEDMTLPKRLQEAGYTTGFVGKNHTVQVDNIEGFASFNADARDPEILSKLKRNYEKVRKGIKKAGFDYGEALYHNNPNFIGVKELAVHNMDWIAQAGVNFIKQNNENPFFLYFATTLPHGPYENERSWKANPMVTAEGFLEDTIRVMPSRQSISKRIQESGISANQAENLLWMDDALGALIQTLEENGLDENTIIFFFNDHGQLAKGTVYQGGTYNPSIIWKKGGWKCGNTSEALISNIDFAPTILELAGANSGKEEFDGQSFLGVLEDEEFNGRKSAYFELGFARGVRKGDWKYIAVRYPEYAINWNLSQRDSVLNKYNDGRRFRNMKIVNEDPSEAFSHLEIVPGGGQAEAESTGKYNGYYDPDQLYNLSEDPGEQNNLANNSEFKGKLAEMKSELIMYLEDLPGRFGELKK